MDGVPTDLLLDALELALWIRDSARQDLTETVACLYKTECVKIDGPFRIADKLELASLSWVHLVQRGPAAFIDRVSHLDRERERVLLRERLQASPDVGRTRPPLNPGRFT